MPRNYFLLYQADCLPPAPVPQVRVHMGVGLNQEASPLKSEKQLYLTMFNYVWNRSHVSEVFEDEGVAELGPVSGAGLDEEAVSLLSGGFFGGKWLLRH